MKTISFLLALAALPLTLLGTDCIPDCECDTDWTLEVRGAYYKPSSKQLRHVYSSSLIDYQVTLAKRVFDYCEIWGEFDWAVKRGRDHHREYDDCGFRNRTRLSLIPISLGVKFIYSIMCRVDVYVGAGAAYSFLHIKNSCEEDYYPYRGFSYSPMRKDIYKNGWGGVLKAGFQVALSDQVFLDFFADYYSQKFHFSRHDYDYGRSLFKHGLDCSGFKLGAGLGVYF